MRIRDLAAIVATLAFVTTAHAGGKPRGKGKAAKGVAPRPNPRYRLEPIEGATDPVAIGEGGQIALSIYIKSPSGMQIMAAHAWVAGKLAPLESPDGQMSQVHDIHPDGTMVGMAAHHATLWRNGKATDLTPGMLWAEARAINASGVVVGNFRRTSADVDKCFQWAGGSFIELPLPGCSDINARGQVLGGGQVWSTKGVVKLQQPAGMERFGTLYLNDEGMVAGTAFMGLQGGGDRPFVWGKDGKATRLHDQAGEIRGINAKGQIVGRTGVRGDLGAVLWEPDGKLVILEDLIAERDWHLVDALGINDKGQIIGRAYVGKGGNDKRTERAFVLTPLD